MKKLLLILIPLFLFAACEQGHIAGFESADIIDDVDNLPSGDRFSLDVDTAWGGEMPFNF